MKKIIYSLLFVLTILVAVGCEKTGYDLLDGTVWKYNKSFYSDYFEKTLSYTHTLRFDSTSYTIEHSSNTEGVYSTTTGVYDATDYPTIVMVDDDNDIYTVEIDGDQLSRGNNTYYKQ